MKPKQKAKITVDVLMTVLLMVLMAYPITGQLAHEWVGRECSCCSSFTMF